MPLSSHSIDSGAGIADVIQRSDDLFEINTAVTERTEIPAALGVAEVEVRSENAGPSVKLERRVLHVHVVDAVGKLGQEANGVDLLPVQVARVEIEAESFTAVYRFDGALGGDDIEGDLRRMHFKSKTHPALVEHVENRVPHLGEVLEALFDRLFRHRRKTV